MPGQPAYHRKARRLPSAGLWLGQRQRQWPNLKPSLGQCRAFAVI